MNKKIINYIIWLIGSVILFFCLFGSTDSEGFHSGWIISTRPGWLWLTITFYISTFTIGFFVTKKLNSKYNKKL